MLSLIQPTPAGSGSAFAASVVHDQRDGTPSRDADTPHTAADITTAADAMTADDAGDDNSGDDSDASADASADASNDATTGATSDASCDASADASNDATTGATSDASCDASSNTSNDATTSATSDASCDASYDATVSAIRDASCDASSGASCDATASASSDASIDFIDASLFGVGAYHNVRSCITLRAISSSSSGLFATAPLPSGSVVWRNRSSGPAELCYRHLSGSAALLALTPAERRYFLRYSYQNGPAYYISPLTLDEVRRDCSNFWNHSCDPNTYPADADTWVLSRAVEPGDQLTIDYATFDSNRFICITHCLCGARACRRHVRGDDYRIVELRARYGDDRFLPYIRAKMADDARRIAAAIAAHGPPGAGALGGAGGPTGDFSAASVRAYHDANAIDVDEHNARELTALANEIEQE